MVNDHVEQAAKALTTAQMMLRRPTHDYDNVSAAALVGIGHALLAVAEQMADAPRESPEAPA